MNMHKGYTSTPQTGMFDGHVDHERIFAKDLAEELVHVLNIDYNNQSLIKNMFEAHFYAIFSKRFEHEDPNSCGGRPYGNFLGKYMREQFEILGTETKKRLKLPDSLKIDHSHAVHAKFATIVEYLKIAMSGEAVYAGDDLSKAVPPADCK